MNSARAADAGGLEDPGLFDLHDPDDMLRTAWLTVDGVYRWSLTRTWRSSLGRVAWVMLNPSTADATTDDATVRRCIGFSRTWGFGSLVIRNLYSLRATDPAELWKHADPVGSRTDAMLADCVLSELVVCAWGRHGARDGRGDAVAARLRSIGGELHHLGLTGNGQPVHPLRLRSDLKPVLWKEM